MVFSSLWSELISNMKSPINSTRRSISNQLLLNPIFFLDTIRSLLQLLLLYLIILKTIITFTFRKIFPVPPSYLVSNDLLYYILPLPLKEKWGRNGKCKESRSIILFQV